MSEIETVRLSTQRTAQTKGQAKFEVCNLIDALERNAEREGIDPDWRTLELEFDTDYIDGTSISDPEPYYIDSVTLVYATVKGVKK